jgi:very-short-patch-repair endonuclease
MGKIIHYKPKLKTNAKKLRKKSTLSEVLMWNKLKNKQINGYKFSRQKPIDKYIVDFYCKELSLAIEIDGITHFDQTEYDKTRQNGLENLGVKFLRFGDTQIKTNINGVVMEIKDWINNHM